MKKPSASQSFCFRLSIFWFFTTQLLVHLIHVRDCSQLVSSIIELRSAEKRMANIKWNMKLTRKQIINGTSSYDSLILKMHLSTCKTVLCISFLSIFIFCEYLAIVCKMELCVFFLSIFSFPDVEMPKAWLKIRPSNRHAPPVSPMKSSSLVVLHHAFCDFNKDTSGWLYIFMVEKVLRFW